MAVPTVVFADKLGAIAAALASCFAGIAGLETFAYDPMGGDRSGSPSACVVGFRTERVDIDQREQQIGSRTWTLHWDVHLYITLQDPETDYPLAYSLMGQMVGAIDADDQLGTEVQEAKLVEGSLAPSPPDEQRTRQLIGQCTVRTKFLMPDLTI